MAKSRVLNLNSAIRNDVREAVSLAVEYWPNSHLGTQSRRDDIRSAFRMLRSWSEVQSIQCAIGRVSASAYSCADM